MSGDERSNVILLPLFRAAKNVKKETHKESLYKIKIEGLSILTPPSLKDLEAAIEAILFASAKELCIEKINDLLAKPGKKNVYNALRDIQDRLEYDNCGIQLMNIARGWQLRTSPKYAKYIKEMKGAKATKLSKAALESLAIIAYRQPVTRVGIDLFRGVDSGAVLKVLIDHSLVEIVGRKKEAGCPLLYGTTNTFLSMFNLQDLADLPTLKDLREFEVDSASFGSSPKES